MRTDARAHACRLPTTSTALATHAIHARAPMSPSLRISHTCTASMILLSTLTAPPARLHPHGSTCTPLLHPPCNGAHLIPISHWQRRHSIPFPRLATRDRGGHVASAPLTFFATPNLPNPPHRSITFFTLLLPNTLYPHDLLAPFPVHTLLAIYTPPLSWDPFSPLSPLAGNGVHLDPIHPLSAQNQTPPTATASP